MAVLLVFATAVIFIFTWRWVSRFLISKGKKKFISHLVGAISGSFAAIVLLGGVVLLFKQQIHNKAWQGDIKAIKNYIEKGGNVDEVRDGNTILAYAAGGGNIELVEFLISKGAEINSPANIDGTPLHYAAREGHAEVVSLLLSKAAKPDVFADKHTESYSGHPDVFPYWCTPLHWAIYSKKSNDTKKIEIVKVLLDGGADPNACSDRCGTPLSEAAKSGNVKVAKLLLEKGASVNLGGPTHEAVLNNRYEMVEFLLKNGAEVNARRIYGTLLVPVSELAGKPFSLSQSSKTPLQLAKRDDIKMLLRRYGAKE